MLTTRYKATFNRWLEPLAVVVTRLGISPSAITLAALVLTVLVCWWFVRTAAVIPFCIAVIAVGCLDGLDGAVARCSGRVTKFGGYLDAVCDRVMESTVALSVAWVTDYWLLVSVVLVGALLVSYTKARAAMEVVVSNLEWPDLMERAERGVVFIGGLALSELVSWQPMGHDLFWWALIVLIPLVYLTVVQRIFRARRIIAERSRL